MKLPELSAKRQVAADRAAAIRDIRAAQTDRDPYNTSIADMFPHPLKLAMLHDTVMDAVRQGDAKIAGCMAKVLCRKANEYWFPMAATAQMHSRIRVLPYTDGQ